MLIWGGLVRKMLNIVFFFFSFQQSYLKGVNYHSSRKFGKDSKNITADWVIIYKIISNEQLESL